MTFDGFTTRSVVTELREKVLGGRIHRIYQPDDTSLILHIYSGENYKLFISCNSSHPRFHLSEIKQENPQTPPQFCMLMRKHLQGGRITEISQLGMDRTVFLKVQNTNELQDTTEKTLVIEIMGKHSNVILVEEGRILDALKRVSFDMSRVRQIYPGKEYTPFLSDKAEPDAVENLRAHLEETLPEDVPVFRAFYRSITGCSPRFGKEVAARSFLDPRKRLNQLTEEEWQRLEKSYREIVARTMEGDFTPSLYLSGEKEFWPFPLKSIGPADEKMTSMSHCIDKYYVLTLRTDRLGQKRKHLLELIGKEREKNAHLIANMEAERLDSSNYEEYKLEGDLLSSQVHLIQKGMEQVEVQDFYQGNQPRVIQLDPKKSPWENIEKKYKTSTKKKRSLGRLKVLIPRRKEEQEYLDNLLNFIEQADTLGELQELETEIADAGYIKKTKKHKKKKQQVSGPMEFDTPDGGRIYVGRNSRQNDELTLRFANKSDLWFHAKDIPGSHVLLRTDGEPSKEDIDLAAFLAAYYSNGRNEGVVQVDQSQKNQIKKAKGAKPGLVYYTATDSHFVDVPAGKKEYQEILNRRKK